MVKYKVGDKVTVHTNFGDRMISYFHEIPCLAEVLYIGRRSIDVQCKHTGIRQYVCSTQITPTKQLNPEDFL
jgi:hypothetical protein